LNGAKLREEQEEEGMSEWIFIPLSTPSKPKAQMNGWANANGCEDGDEDELRHFSVILGKMMMC
jgi:hypothetical protein